MKKENLILVHSFPTNSIILKGFIDYLKDYLNLYFIDLPGFTKRVPPLLEINLSNYSKFVDKKIKELDLNEYIVGGISFGFLVINNAKLNGRCRGILAIQPFTDVSSLRMTFLSRILYSKIFDTVTSLKLYNKIWDSKIFYKSVKLLSNKSQKRVKSSIYEIDAKTFFETGKLIFDAKQKNRFHKLPYSLIVNKKDERVRYDYLVQLFNENVKDLLIVDTKIEHSPKIITKEYFRENFDEKDIDKIFNFFKGNTNNEKRKPDFSPLISYQ